MSFVSSIVQCFVWKLFVLLIYCSFAKGYGFRAEAGKVGIVYPLCVEGRSVVGLVGFSFFVVITRSFRGLFSGFLETVIVAVW